MGLRASRAHPVQAVMAGLVVFLCGGDEEVEFAIADELEMDLLIDMVAFEAAVVALREEMRDD